MPLNGEVGNLSVFVSNDLKGLRRGLKGQAVLKPWPWKPGLFPATTPFQPLGFLVLKKL